MKRVNIVLVCDFCGSEDNVEKREMTVDGKAAKKDTCPECWAYIWDAIKEFMADAKSPKRRSSKGKRS